MVGRGRFETAIGGPDGIAVLLDADRHSTVTCKWCDVGKC
jgi:hypothetical protein